MTLSAVHPQVGTVNDVSQISENVREHSRAWVLVDATALAGFSPITIDDLGVDMVIVINVTPLLTNPTRRDAAPESPRLEPDW